MIGEYKHQKYSIEALETTWNFRAGAPDTIMATDFGMMSEESVLKLMVVPMSPKSSGHMMKRQNQRMCFSTLRAR